MRHRVTSIDGTRCSNKRRGARSTASQGSWASEVWPCNDTPYSRVLPASPQPLFHHGGCERLTTASDPIPIQPLRPLSRNKLCCALTTHADVAGPPDPQQHLLSSCLRTNTHTHTHTEEAGLLPPVPSTYTEAALPCQQTKKRGRRNLSPAPQDLTSSQHFLCSCRVSARFSHG